MIRRRLPDLVGLAIACAVLGFQVRAQSDQGGYSRHCPVEKETGRMPAPTYVGDYNVLFLAKGGAQQGIESLLVRVHGTLKLDTFDGKVDKVSGKAEYLYAGSGMAGKIMLLGLNFTGDGQLEKRGAASDYGFGALATMSIRGGASARTSNAHVNDVRGASGVLTLDFNILQATCDVASGTFTSSEFDQTARAMAAKGFQVSEYQGTWSVSSFADAAKKQKELLDKLNKQPPAGIVRTREAEATRLGKIADDIKKEKEEVRECLFKIWLQHARKLVAQYIQEDTAKIKAYKGDAPGLDGLMSRALEAARSLALIGMDECEEALHNQLWNAIAAKLSEVLTKMVKGNAPLHDILRILKNAQLLGVVSPELEQTVASGIQAQARQLADAAWSSLRGTAQKHGNNSCDPEVRTAIGQALHAARAYQLLGGDEDYAQGLMKYITTLTCKTSRQ